MLFWFDDKKGIYELIDQGEIVTDIRGDEFTFPRFDGGYWCVGGIRRKSGG